LVTIKHNFAKSFYCKKWRHFFLALLSISVVLALFSESANADWQYTRWGMTKSETVTASGRSAKTPRDPDTFDNDKLKHLLSAPYISEDFRFVAKFYFNTKERLVEVRLELADLKKCSSLVGALRNTYGQTETDHSSAGGLSVLKWRDSVHGNIVLISELKDSWCNVLYQPIKKAGQKNGL
jgi:hypothetical protein